LNEQQQHSSTSLVSSSGEQYHQIHDNVTHQQYVVRSPNRSPSSPIIPVKPSISKHSRIGEYQGKFSHFDCFKSMFMTIILLVLFIFVI
jgi:hypothetical protein